MVAVVVVYGINAGDHSPTRQGLIFLLFSIFMALGAVYAWAYLPNLQRRKPDFLAAAASSFSPSPLGPAGAIGAAGAGAAMSSISLSFSPPVEEEMGKLKLETKNLEDLGEGRERARLNGEVVTIKEKIHVLRRRRRDLAHALSRRNRGQNVGLG